MKKRDSLQYRHVFQLFISAFAFLILISSCSLAQVSAAAKKTKSKTVLFTDDSGSYLKSSGSAWYLYDSEQKPLGGLQYLAIPKTEVYSKGFYMFNSQGKLLKKSAVYHFARETNHGIQFNGYYYTDKNGRFWFRARKLCYLNGLRCNGRTFQGYYYVEPYGHILNTRQVCYLPKKTVNKVTFPAGYYWFSKSGKISTKKVFRQLNQTVGEKKFKGLYYFGENRGSLRTKRGWVTVGSKKYYLFKSGRVAQNRWISNHYVLEDGSMAKSREVPGGYVDSDGKRCSKEDMYMGPLKKTLQRMVAGYSGSWSVYVKDLKTGGTILINDTSIYPASTIKAFVMASTFQQIKDKKLKRTGTINELLRYMITISDNESTNELVRCHSASHSFAGGCGVINAWLKKNGFTKTRIHHTLQPAYSAYASDGGGSNVITASEAGKLLEKIYRGTCVSKAYSKEMVKLMLQQQRRWKIPAGLPSGVKVANKTGETNSYEHDIAIVYGKKTDYILCVFTRYGYSSGIQQISRTVYNALN